MSATIPFTTSGNADALRYTPMIEMAGTNNCSSVRPSGNGLLPAWGKVTDASHPARVHIASTVSPVAAA
jgi:hypothetical protein